VTARASTPLRIRRSRAVRLALAASLAAAGLAARPRPASAAGETSGRVVGYVTEESTGGALYDVPLTIRGSALQGEMTRKTDESGRFEFPDLPPGGDYELVVKAAGFAPARRAGVTVLLGRTTAVDLALKLAAETAPTEATPEVVSVTERANPLIDPESAQTGAVLGAEKAAKTPIFTQVQAIPQLVAGVGPGNTPSTRGGLARYGRFYVDGMDTTDVTDGSITAPMNFFAVENFEVITGGMDAQYNSMGMVENVVTKTGSNSWSYDLSLTLSPDILNAKNKIPASQPAFGGLYTNNDLASPKTSFWSPTVGVGGPLVKDRLWFYASAQLNLSSRETPITTAATPFENRPTDTTTALARLKLTWQATQSDRLSLAFNLDQNTIDNSIGSASVTRDAESKIDRGGYFLILNYDRYFTESLSFHVQMGTTYKHANQDPQSGDLSTVSHTDSLGGLTQFNAGRIAGDIPGAFLHETKTRAQFDPWITLRLGRHEAKAGVQLAYLGDTQSTGVPGYQRFLDRGGVCDPGDPTTFGACSERVDFYNSNGDRAPLTTTASALTAGVFVQDRWNVSKKLVLAPGFRVDIGRLYGDSGALVTTLVGYGPRFSASYDVLGDRKNLIVFHYGRSNDVGNIFIAQHANPQLTQLDARFQNGAFPDCVFGQAVPGCTVSGGAAGRVFARNQTPPYVDEIAAGYHREIATDAVVGADATYRYYGNLWADEEVNRIWDPSGTAIVGYVDGTPRSILSTQTPASAYREYAGLDLWVQGNPGRWDLLASYTLAYNDGTVADYFDGYLANPRFTRFYDGWVPDDRRHTLKGSIAYSTTWGLDLGARLQFRTGTPMWESFPNPGDGTQKVYRSPRGTGFATNPATGLPDFNDPSSWVETRNPSQVLVDVQARYNVGAALHTTQRFEVVGLLVNAFNNVDPVALVDSYSSRGNRFGLAASRNAPMQGEIILRVRN
jgi:hypothetical protein